MRNITPTLLAFIDSKLAASGQAQLALQNKDARAMFQCAAMACVGIMEATGNNDGPLIQEIQKTVDGLAQHEPYCCAAVQSWLAYAELRTGIQSPIAATELCLGMWHDTPVEQRVQHVPLPGAIVVWEHGDTSLGHTGMLLNFLPDGTFRTVEANTSGGAGGTIDREGQGIFYRTRSMQGAGTMRLVGFLKPF